MGKSETGRVSKRDAAIDGLLEGLKHDLRIPISNILGYADLVRDQASSPLSADQEAFLSRIEDNCRSVLSLLDRLAGAADQLRREEP